MRSAPDRQGTLIWGARTLAGNDNEWRYVSGAALQQHGRGRSRNPPCWAVFEPNDANTGQGTGHDRNYLTQKWREGAHWPAPPPLPGRAFFIALDLGTTMSSQDILEGRMYVEEIGMAVVRPAGSAILKSYHKLQTS